MRITGVEAIPISLTLRKPVKMADKVIEVSRNVVVKVSTDEGIAGWGEAAAAPQMTGHTRDVIVAGVEHLAAGLVGADPRRRAELWSQMRGSGHGNSSSIAALDVALHDLVGRTLAVPVVELLGGAVRPKAPAVALFGSGEPKADTDTAVRMHDAGYRWLKMKLGIASPELEKSVLEGLHARFGDECVLAGDANTAWTAPQAISNLRLLEDAGLAFVEQPVAADDVDGMDRVASAVNVPIGADEGVHGIADVVRYASTSVAGVSLKLIKMGGVTGVVHAAILASYLGLETNLGGKVAETSISSAALAHVAAAVPTLGWGVSLTHDLVDQDVVREPLPITDGWVVPPARPGLGIDVDEDALDRLRD